MMQNEDDSNNPQLTIIENDGPRLFVPPPQSKAPPPPQQPSSPFGHSSTTQPSLSPGDDANPNNYLPLSLANPFVCPVSITLGSSSLANKKHILPKSISLATTLANNGTSSNNYHLLHQLRISFQNDLQETAAALLSIPRLSNILLLEEEHECGGIKYKPKVEEKELAQYQYQQAAASQDKTATLAEIGCNAHYIKLDKVPAGANGVFVVRFLQVGGLKTRGEVSTAVQEEEVQQQSGGARWTKRSIADIAILPGFTCLDCTEGGGGVPFDYTLSFENADNADAEQIITVELPEEEVLAKDLEDADENYNGMRISNKDILSIVQLAPSLLSEKKEKNVITSTLTWKSLAGLARGTLLKVRLVCTQHSKNDYLNNDKVAAHPPPSSPEILSKIVQNIDTIPGIIHDAENGIKCDSSLLDLEIPMSLPASLSCPSKQQQHELYIIVDTSGSTSMRSGEGGQSFLETAKSLLDGILLDLPCRIRSLKSMRAINDTILISVKLWSFDTNTKYEAETTIESSKGAASVIEPLRTRVSQMRSGGATNYDSWASKLQSMVSTNPSNLHSVLLITDGGATRRERFFETIDSISSSSLSAGGFFQVDSLGYGPWLDPACVSYLSARTGGEALMVESLHGKGTREKVLSILARSLLRAASKLSLHIENAKLLAMSNGGGEAGDEDGGGFCSPVETMFPTPCLRVYPGQKLRLVLLHPSNSMPQLKLQAGDESSNFAMIPCKRQTDGWEIVSPPPSSAEVTKKVPLCHPNALRALRHLPMLEPAYARPGSVHHPPSTAVDRTAVTLKTSILGQIVAPSVTKSIAVVELDSNNHLEPVPEHRRPEPVSFKEMYPKYFQFYEEKNRASRSSGPFGGFSSTPTNAGASPFGATAVASGSPFGFGSPAPATSHAFGSPAPASSHAFGSPAPAASHTFGSPAPVLLSAPAPAPFGFRASTAQQHSGSVGFKVTKPSLGKKDSVPTTIDWIHSTRGGMYPADAKRFHQSELSSNAEGKRLTKETLRDYLRNYTSLPTTHLLHAIECTIALFPNKTGSLTYFDRWVSQHKGDISSLSSVGLVCQDIVSAGGLALHASPVFPWQASDIGKISVNDIVGRKANAENANEVAERKKFLSVINTSVRRDVYNILINPTHPNKGADLSSNKGDGSIPFGAALLAKASGGREIDTFAFVDRDTIVGSLPEDYQVLDDSNVVDAISNMGSAHPCALAVLEAFEDYVKSKAENWIDEDISLLSVEFLVAFGRELTARLDVHHRIRSKKLSNDEILLLRNEPYASYVNQGMIRAFQDGPTWVGEKLSK